MTGVLYRGVLSMWRCYQCGGIIAVAGLSQGLGYHMAGFSRWWCYHSIGVTVAGVSQWRGYRRGGAITGWVYFSIKVRSQHWQSAGWSIRPSDFQRSGTGCQYRARMSVEHPTMMMDSHWLPILRRVTFNAATLIYKCLHGSRAFHACGPAVWNSSSRTLRSSELSYNCFRE